MKRTFTLSLLCGIIMLGLTGEVVAQGQTSDMIKPMQTKDIEPIICYFTPEDMHTTVPLRAELEQLAGGRLNATQGSAFIVDYVGFSAAQQAAFQYAVDIWSVLLNSDVQTRIYVEMSSELGAGTLASTGWGGLNANFDNAQRINTWYVVAMAEKIAGRDMNDPANPDIVMRFNAANAWYLGTDGNPGSGTFDLVSVALHEIGHGLGFFSHTFADNGVGSWGNNVNGIPLIYTQHIEDGSGSNLVESFTNNSTQLGDALTGDNLFFNSLSFTAGLPKLYAPATFNSGSSIAHLDEATFLPGSTNSLMTPQIGRAEAIHDPGIALDMLEDMGWISMKIEHQRLKDTETLTGPYTVTAVISGDNPLVTDSATLHYTFTDFNNEQVLIMQPTGNLNEFSADIPLPGNATLVSYYIKTVDDQDRKFFNPGEAPAFFHQFTAAADTISPEILHQPLNVVFTFNPVAKVVATVVDNIGVGDLQLTYKLNGVAGPTPISVPLINQSDDGHFSGDYELNWDLGALGVKKGDVIEYKLSITDVSVAANTAVHPSPAVGFNKILIDALNPATKLYANDFNTTTDDFVGVGFDVATLTGFSNGAIHSDHPYRADRGAEPEDTIVLSYLLKTPIILSAANPSLRYDEVALIEPGEAGSVFGDDDFWDYVVVEGSSDLGVTWHPLTDGYDVREYADWQTQWDSDIVVTDNVPDSEAPGNEGLFRTRDINMLANGNFSAGDEILVRFKLYADQLAVGWGWVIDNIKIQIDDIAPEIAHIAPDYLNIGDTELSLLAKITDNAVLDSVIFEINIDGTTTLFGIDEEVDIYQLNITINPATTSSIVKYRIIAVDSADSPNTTILPATGFFEIPVANIGETKTVYLNDFNTASSDFIGTNFTIAQETGFDDAAIQSLHPYSNAVTGEATMSYLLRYPIKLKNGAALMSFDEVVLVDRTADKVVVEASKDNGTTWIEISEPFDASDRVEWLTEFNKKDSDGKSIGVGSSSLLKYHLINLLSNPELTRGDVVLIRFTMKVNDNDNGWGWAIDNLEIQGPTTNIEDNLTGSIRVYPNPSQDGRIRLTGNIYGANSRVSIADLSGKVVYTKTFSIAQNQLQAEMDLSILRKGIYIIKVASEQETFSLRVMIK